MKSWAAKIPLQRRETILFEWRRLVRRLIILDPKVARRAREWEIASRSDNKSILTEPSQRQEIWDLSPQDEVISKELYILGQFDFEKLVTALALLKKSPCDTLMDVGANIGSICVPAVGRGYFEQAVAIEASPLLANRLARNVSLNKLEKQIHIVNLAAGSESGQELAIYFDSKNHGSTQTRTLNAHLPPQPNVVKTCALDELVHPDHQKIMLFMDIEGFEFTALRGARTLMDIGSPLVLEFSPRLIRDSGTGIEEIMELLGSYKFVFSLNDPLRVKYPTSYLRVIWDAYSRDSGPFSTDLLFVAENDLP